MKVLSLKEKMARASLRRRMLLLSLLRGRSRFLSTLFALAVGTTILAGLLGLYLDIPRQLSREFRSYGANLVLLGQDLSRGISRDVAAEARKIIPADRLVGFAPYLYEKVKINEQPFTFAATELAEARANSPYWLVDGAWPENEKEILVGKEIAEQIGVSIGGRLILSRTSGDSQSMDERVNVQREYKVTGLVLTGGKEEAMIFASLEAHQRMFEARPYDVIEVSMVGSEAEIDDLAAQMETAFPGLEARPAKRLTSSQDQVLNKLQTLVWVVSLIVILLTTISVTTTMLAAVTERRREIGLKKALGAENRELIREFMSEGVLLGLLGGALGIGAGYIFASRVALSIFTRRLNFAWELIPLTLIMALVMTSLACIFPVRKATQVEPALVLRGE